MIVREGVVSRLGSLLGAKCVGPGFSKDGAKPPLREAAAAISFLSFVKRGIENLSCWRKMRGHCELVSRIRVYWWKRYALRSE
jgi:hypothetical protein